MNAYDDGCIIITIEEQEECEGGVSRVTERGGRQGQVERRKVIKDNGGTGCIINYIPYLSFVSLFSVLIGSPSQLGKICLV